MARLYSDLLDGTGRRYYFGLTSAPGGITNATPAMLTLGGNAATIQEQTTVFRNPATAMLALFGYARSSGTTINAGLATLTVGGQIPGEQRLLVITNALPPDYSVLPDLAPTIIYIATISPTQATLTLAYPPPNLTQGGNIAFVSPGIASLTIQGQSPVFPHLAEVGLLTINGFAATLLTTLSIQPDAGLLTLGGLEPSFGVPFTWIDDDPVLPPTWIDDPRA